MDIGSIIAGFGGLFWTIAAFVVALSVIVAVHEYGHYIVGRWSGIHAEVFSLGFGPVLFSRTDKHGTVWQVAALPFGGYVKFAGDANAASAPMDEAAMIHLDAEARRRTMTGAPLWARSATVAAGPVFNFILSFLIFALVAFWQGRATDPIVIDAVAAQVGELQAGDTVLAIGGIEVDAIAEFGDVVDAIEPTPTVTWTIERDGRAMDVPGPYPFPPLVAGVQPQSAAYDADLRQGDLIVSVDGAPVAAFEQLREVVVAGEGAPVLLEVLRDGERFEALLVPRRVDLPLEEGGFDTRYMIGVTGGIAIEPATERLGLLDSMAAGVDRTLFIVRSSLSGLWNIVTGAISSCNISGPIGIAQASGAMASQGTVSFFFFIGVLSTAVGLLNLFPVPVLDGGHLVFHAYEAVARRKPSEKAMRLLMTVGLTMILALMAFAITNDIFCP